MVEEEVDFTGQPMKSMLFVDATGSDSDEALHEWVESALAFVFSLPPRKVAGKKSIRGSREGNGTVIGMRQTP